MSEIGFDTEEDIVVVLLRTNDNQTFEVPLKHASLSCLVKTIVESDREAKEIELPHVDAETLEQVIAYLVHHQGIEPPEIRKPLASTVMKEIVGEWDAEFISSFSTPFVFKLLLAANYMDIKSLLNLGCARVASLIKGKSKSEIKAILTGASPTKAEEFVIWTLNF